jgi:hypothetical protein
VTRSKKIYERHNKIVLQLRTLDKILLSLGNYFVDILIVYLEKHYDDIYSRFVYGRGLKFDNCLNLTGFRENGGKPKQENWTQ